MKFRILLAAALAVMSTGAFAADPPLIVDPDIDVDPVHDWNGFYVGVNGGYSTGIANFDFPAVPSGVDVPIAGWNLGVVAGGAWQSDMFVLGVEGEIGWTNLNGATPCPNPAFTCAVSANWLADLELQAGVAVDSLLLYVHAGVAALNTTATTAPFVPGTATQVATGWVAGVGAKVAVSEDVTLVGEYSYYNVSMTVPAGPLDPTSPVINPTFHKVTVGANWHF